MTSCARATESHNVGSLSFIARAEPELRDEARVLAQGAKELHLIFAKLYRSSP